MKNKSLPLLARFTGSFLILLATCAGAFAYPSGSPAGYTGSPGDGQHCVSCHNGSATTVSGWITSNIPAQGYTPGAIYTITVTVSGSGKKGFEVSPQNVTGTQLGVLAAGTGNHLTGGTKYVTQNSSGSTSSTVSWSFTWTSPVSGTGTVTFYGAFTVGKSNTKLSTLVVEEDPALPLAATASATPPDLCAGQSCQLNVSPAGGSGAYTYSWTSIPPGFTSTLQNPVVIPEISTQYIATVSDGSGSTDAMANVAVTRPATAAAGNDTTCAFNTISVPLNGTASNFSAVQWTTSGTGTFSAGSSLAGTYLPGAADKTSGGVTLTLTASAQPPCSAAATDTRVIQFEWATGTGDSQDVAIDLVISPNPSAGRFTIRLSGPDVKEAAVTISDMCGKMVVRNTLQASASQAEQFDMTGYPRGIYFVKVETGVGTVVRKLVLD